VDSAHRRCEKHRIQERKEINQRCGSAARRGYDARWRAARKRFPAIHPLCVECRRQGRVQAATVEDHIVPHKGDMSLFWDIDNWEAICNSRHDQKTASQDGGFGNRSQ
jgi:5-methylcytosine-specific restriction protein A